MKYEFLSVQTTVDSVKFSIMMQPYVKLYLNLSGGYTFSTIMCLPILKIIKYLNIRDKDEAIDIDQTCHNLANTSHEIDLHPGVRN